MHRRLMAAATPVAAAAMLTLALAGCGSSSSKKSDSSSSSSGGTGASKADLSKASSASDVGGMDALVTAAKKEGTLNVIALPLNWANYGAMLTAFKKKYNIKINSANPDGSSQDEINAVKTLKGQSRAPDVLDVGLAFAYSGQAAGLFAPYKVTTWSTIPDNQKDPGGAWYQDYGGFISIGYNAKTVSEAPTSLADLLKPAYKRKVALNGDPTKANAAFSGVFAAALANGGSFDNIQPGLDYFKKLKQAGNFVPVQASPATIQNGQTPVTLDWDYLQAGYAEQFKGKLDWKVVIPKDALYGGFYAQAISKYAPHPAAARLWQEFLYSDEGQNIWLQGKARPVRLPAMQKAGTANATYVKALPSVPGTPSFPSQAQVDKAKQVVADGWAKAVG